MQSSILFIDPEVIFSDGVSVSSKRDKVIFSYLSWHVLNVNTERMQITDDLNTTKARI